jgi:hypothetical protein
MPDQFNWDFVGARDAKAEIRAAVRYLLSGVSGSARGDMVRDIIEIVLKLRTACHPAIRIPWMMSCPADSPSMTLGRPPVRGASRGVLGVGPARP